MSPQDQQTFNDVLKWLAISIPLIISVVSAAGLALYKSYTDARKTFAVQQTNQTKDLAQQMTQILEKTTDTMNQLVRSQAQSDVLVKRAMDRQEPLESALKANSDVINQFKEATVLLTTTLNGTIRQMTESRSTIIAQVNDHTDSAQAGVISILNGVKAGTDHNASQLTGLAQKADERQLMSEESFKDLIKRLDQLPSTVADQLKPIIQELRDENTRLEANNQQLSTVVEQLTAELAALKKKAEEPDGKPPMAPA